MATFKSFKYALNKSRRTFRLRDENLEAARDLRSYLSILELRYKVRFTSVFDIGAHQGTWSTSLAGAFLNTPNFFLFEPNVKHKSQLQATGFPNFCVLLAESEHWIDFYSINGTGDSVFPENSKHYENIRPQQLLSRTLDSVCEEFELSPPTLIKLDTQGSEISILKGGQQTLQGVSLLYLEIPVLHYNGGAPSFDQYMEYISSINFLPVGLFEIHISHGVLVQVDILFMSQELFSEVYGNKDLDIALKLL
jgi:FkbM family methyltransferase